MSSEGKKKLTESSACEDRKEVAAEANKTKLTASINPQSTYSNSTNSCHTQTDQASSQEPRACCSKTIERSSFLCNRVNFPEGDRFKRTAFNSLSLCSGEDVSSHNHSQRPKSVSFHTGSSLPIERKVSNALDCLRYMINGSSLVKVRAGSRQYRRFFSLEEDLSALRWVPSSKKSSKARLSIRCMKEVRMGRSTDVLRTKEIAWTYSEDCAFSIFYNDTFESLDLIASTPEEANIWVTGLNLLIGASKSPDTFDERQKMREKWLREVFAQADTDQTGLLNECETISLMKKLNNQLSTVRLRQKIMEFEHGKLGEERGRIDSSDFINIFKETSTRPEIYFLLVRFSGKDYMTLEDFLLFVEGEQGMVNMDYEKCLKIIKDYEPSEEAKKNKQLLIDGFTSFLLSESCDIMHPDQKTVYQNMTNPFAHYFISTSHNTYLLEDQLKGPSGTQGYASALKAGCRCIKVDCWDCAEGPVVFHGNTLTTKIPLKDVLEVIRDNAFSSSPYPLILHLENHCSIVNQQKIVSLLVNIFGDMLYHPLQDEHRNMSEMTPELLKGKILIKSLHFIGSPFLLQGKKLSPICDEATGDVSDEDDDHDCQNNKDVFKKTELCKGLSDLVSLTKMRFRSTEMTEDIQKIADVSSFSETIASKLCQVSPEELISHNKQYLTHVFPNSSRVDSSNYNALDFWICGCQLVAMNYQTAGHMMDIYQGWFQQNGCCGYVLKPSFLREPLHLFCGGCIPGLEPTTLYLKVISAQQLPQPKGASSKASSIDPYVVVQIYGIPIDCAEARTRTVSNEGHSPIFDESFEFTITVPELAMLRISVLDDEFIGDDFIGQYSIPVSCLQTGYRHFRLLCNGGEAIPNTTLFFYISITTRSEEQRARRKKAWLSLKPVGIKQADSIFKAAVTPLTDAYKMRTDEEQAMLELCKECGLSDSANLVKCLRVLSFRMASSPGVSNFEIISTNDQPSVKVSGELTVCLGRAVSLLEKAFLECNYIRDNAGETLKTLLELYHGGETVWKEAASNTLSLGSKGRKAEKVVESFLWNMTILTVQIDLLKSAKDQSCTSVQRLKQLGPVFSKLFQKERESATSVSDSSNSAMTPVLTNQISLLPFPQQILLTPTSPGDGRLRGILKKTNTPSTPPISLHSNHSECSGVTGGTVFFPASPSDSGKR